MSEALAATLVVDWDVAHISVAVPDLEVALSEYTEAFGLAWSNVVDLGAMEVASPLYPDEEIGMEGLREVWSLNEPALELAHAAPGSAAERIWGVEDGCHRMHHICYWVDDIAAASTYLATHGFPLELTLSPADVVTGFAYHRNGGGMRIELMRNEDKPAIDHWLATGELDLPW